MAKPNPSLNVGNSHDFNTNTKTKYDLYNKISVLTHGHACLLPESSPSLSVSKEEEEEKKKSLFWHVISKKT